MFWLKNFRPLGILFLVLTLGILACDLGDLVGGSGGDKPTVIIISPPSGSQFQEGQEVSLQSLSTDPKGVIRVELLIDGVVVRADPVPSPQTQFNLIQVWKATPGTHTITIRAVNQSNSVSDPAAISVTVGPSIALAGTATPTPTLTVSAPIPPTSSTSTPTPTGTPIACGNDSQFVADVTVPDGTVIGGGTGFNKIWRIRNSGTCAWGVGYEFVLVGGEAMGATTLIAVPNTASGSTADLLVAMTAPSAPGVHAGQWRLRGGGVLFGATFTVSINVPSAAPPCPGPPVIASFTASPNPITAGSSTTLSWGSVSNATAATIDQGIGGVATPGNRSVSPATTTTYTLTATGCGGVATSTVTVTVNPAPTSTPTPTRTPTPTATPATVVRCSIQSESGEVIKSGASRSVTQALYAGDDSSNNSYRAFFSFDIHDIAGKTLNVGNLNIGGTTIQGNPFASFPTGLGTFFVGVLDYGTLGGSDYDAAGTAILSLTSNPNGQHDIKSAIQSAVNASKSRFQLRFHFSGETNNNNAEDILHWASNNNVCLTITYH